MNDSAGSYDVLGLGAVAVDDLLYVDAYPAADVKVRVRSRRRELGGQTGTALIAAARLGAKCAFGGQLGENDLSRYAEEVLRREGVDTSPAARTDVGTPAHSTIIVDQRTGSRTIFSSVSDAGMGPGRGHLAEPVIANARVLLIDHHGVEATLHAVEIAKFWTVPIVADFERYVEHAAFDEMLNNVDHLIVSERFACEATRESGAEAACLALWSEERRAVVVTCGADGGCWIDANSPMDVRYYDAFPVETVDTTGCGDVFHGAYAAMLARGAHVGECVVGASAAAAMKAQRKGGASGCPTRAELLRFLEDRDLRYPCL